MARYPIKLLKDENRQPFFPFTILESVLVNGSEKNLADVLDEKVAHCSVLPEPSEELLGQIVQYVGLSDATYTNGYFYKCVSDGAAEPTYSWENVLVQFQPTRTSHLINDTDFINHDVNNLTYYTLGVETGSTVELAINSSTYVMTLILKNKAGTVISTSTIDFPIESMVVNAVYDNTHKKIILTLQSGSTVDIPLGDLIAGLQNEITAQNKLSADLVDDTNTTNKFVTAALKAAWNAKYDKPANGIPKTDLASNVQASLSKADTALQEMVILEYGTSTWQDFIDAYNNNAIVYCKASDGVDPSSGTKGRMAVMVSVNDPSDPTEVEFQYYKSVASKNIDQQGDQVFIYTLNKTNGWSNLTRNAYTKMLAGTNMNSSYSNGVLTLNCTLDISGKLDANKIKSVYTAIPGDIYDAAYINELYGNINAILETLTTPATNNGGGE